VGGKLAIAATVSAAPTVAPTLDPTVAPPPSPSSTPTPSPSATPTPTPIPTPSLTPTPKPALAKPAATQANSVALATNSLSIPALGIGAPIGTSSCGGLIPDGIWRWPCAGANNMYLLGHAWGVFEPIHDGYHAGSLTVGMLAIYYDGSGAAHRYQLQWVEDLTVADWGKGAAWAATPGPVITLQTCDGAASDYRIIVRFVPD
jgi:hypothetical protein